MTIAHDFIQYGRLICIQAGPHANKIALVTDILDFKTVQVQGVDVPRMVMPIKSLVLTTVLAAQEKPLSVDTVNKLFNEEKLAAQFAATPLGQKVAKELKYIALPEVEKVKLNIM